MVSFFSQKLRQLYVDPRNLPACCNHSRAQADHTSCGTFHPFVERETSQLKRCSWLANLPSGNGWRLHPCQSELPQAQALPSPPAFWSNMKQRKCIQALPLLHHLAPWHQVLLDQGWTPMQTMLGKAWSKWEVRACHVDIPCIFHRHLTALLKARKRIWDSTLHIVDQP